MHAIAWLKRTLLLPATLVTLYSVSACSGGGDYVDHGFEFDAPSDSPGIRILDFKYGDGTGHGTGNPQYLLHKGRPLQRISVRGPMRRPESLYVKWRVASEGRIYEETVDLRKRLPRNFDGSTVYFLVRGAQLEVYLISWEPRQPSVPSVGPRKYRNLQVTKIHPN